MRFVALLGIVFLSAAHPAFARDPTIRDGRFTICAFQNFDKCELLTKRKMRRYDFAAEDKRVLREFRRHAGARRAPLAKLEQSFGTSSKIFPHDKPNDKTIAWFHNSVETNDLNAKCPECGIYVSSINDVVTSINYIVDQKFTLIWNRTGKRKSRR